MFFFCFLRNKISHIQKGKIYKKTQANKQQRRVQKNKVKEEKKKRNLKIETKEKQKTKHKLIKKCK